MSAFKPGDLIYRSKPYAYILNNDIRGERCDNCFKESDELKRCSQCSFVYFCNRNCQVKAWGTHKMECKYIKNAHPNLPNDLLRLLAITVLKLKAFGLEEPSETIYGHKMNFRRLMSHAAEIQQNPKECQQIMAYLERLKAYIGERNIPPTSDFIEIFGKLTVNSFGICGEEMQIIGSGIFLGASIFDHSCEPDAQVVYSGIEICVRAVKNIPHTDVKQISISYISQLQLNQERQDCLRERYYFSCKCSRCTSSYYDDLMTKTLTNKSASEVIETFKKEIDRIRQMREDKVDDTAIYKACLKELERQNGVLATTHILRIKLLEFALEALMENEQQWADAITILKELTDPYKLIYGTHHPILGIHYFTIGKIQLLKLFSESGKINLVKAAEILKVTHGSEHPVYGHLLKYIFINAQDYKQFQDYMKKL